MGGASKKFKNITSIRSNIMKIINEDNLIKRHILYLSNTPMEEFATNYNGETIPQPDIQNIDLIKDKRQILPIFSKSYLNEAKVYIFVKRFESNLSDEIIADNKLLVEIMCPTDYS